METSTTPLIHIDHAARSEEYLRDALRIAQDGVCPYCVDFCQGNAERTYHKKPILIENPYWIFTESQYPYEGAEHHFLMIVRRHIEHIRDLTHWEWDALTTLIEHATLQYQLSGATFILRYGELDRTGASVAHLHAQLISGAKRGEDRGKILTQVGYMAK